MSFTVSYHTRVQSLLGVCHVYKLLLDVYNRKIIEDERQFCSLLKRHSSI